MSEQRIPDWREALGTEAWESAKWAAFENRDAGGTTTDGIEAFLSSLFSQGAIQVEHHAYQPTEISGRTVNGQTVRTLPWRTEQRLTTPWREVSDAVE